MIVDQKDPNPTRHHHPVSLPNGHFEVSPFLGTVVSQETMWKPNISSLHQESTADDVLPAAAEEFNLPKAVTVHFYSFNKSARAENLSATISDKIFMICFIWCKTIPETKGYKVNM